MSATKPDFHYPSGLKLTKRKPLVEAWLEIRWELEETKAGRRDPQFAFAVGRFRDVVANLYPAYEELDAVHVPEEIAPHIVRHRFRVRPDEWPLLQIGPGVASVNFLSYERWEEFQQAALFLRESLLAAYAPQSLTITSVALRYRDVEPFPYAERDVLGFLGQKLNTTISLPRQVPGVVGSTTHPKGVDLKFVFDLTYPVGTGAIRLVTGNRNVSAEAEAMDAPGEMAEEVLVMQLEVMSSNGSAPDFRNQDPFVTWLNAAHDVLHEWFFALIDGPLRDEYGVK